MMEKIFFYLASEDESFENVFLAQVSLNEEDFGNITKTLDLSPFGQYFCGIITESLFNDMAFIVGGVSHDIKLLQINLTSFQVFKNWTVDLDDSYVNCQIVASTTDTIIYFLSIYGFTGLNITSGTTQVLNLPEIYSDANHFVISRDKSIMYWCCDPSSGRDQYSREVAFDLANWQFIFHVDYNSSDYYPESNMYFGTYQGEQVMMYMSFHQNRVPAVNALSFKDLSVLISVPMNELKGYYPESVAGYGNGGNSWLALENSINSKEGVIVEWLVDSWIFDENQILEVSGNNLPFSLQVSPTQQNILYFTGESNSSSQPSLYMASGSSK